MSSTILRQEASSVTSTSSTAVLTPSLASSAAAASDLACVAAGDGDGGAGLRHAARHAQADAAVAAGDEGDAAREIERDMGLLVLDRQRAIAPDALLPVSGRPGSER